MIQAAKIVKEKNKEIHWVFLGDGRQKQNIIDEVLSNSLADNIHLLGSYPSECMPDFFACADALVVSLKKNIASDRIIYRCGISENKEVTTTDSFYTVED